MRTNWNILQPSEYVTRANSTSEKAWEPGLRGAESGALNLAYWLPLAADVGVSPLAGKFLRKFVAGDASQYPYDFYPRNLFWVDQQLYDLYPGISEAFIDKLNQRRINDAHYRDGSVGGNQTGSGWDPRTK